MRHRHVWCVQLSSTHPSCSPAPFECPCPRTDGARVMHCNVRSNDGGGAVKSSNAPRLLDPK
eukprot:2387442-Alexandrium_andersonii.AAC.1